MAPAAADMPPPASGGNQRLASWLFLRVALPAFAFTSLLWALCNFAPGTLARQTLRLGADLVEVSVYERDGTLYASARQQVPWLHHGWSTTQSLTPASRAGAAPVRIELDEAGSEILVRIGNEVFSLGRR